MTEHVGTVPYVSVILPARGAGATLRQAISGVLAGSYRDMEVVVADGDRGGSPVVRALERHDPRVRRVPNPSGGTSAGLNLALAAARGDIVVRMDAHALPAPDYVAACVAALSSMGVAAVGGGLHPTGATRFGRAVARAMRSAFGGGPAAFRQGGAGPVDTVYLGAWRRADLVRWGGFDEGLARNQDYELCERIRAAGGTVWLAPAIRSRTLARSSPGGLLAQYWGYGMGRAGTWRRHPGSLRARQAAPAAFVAGLAGLALVSPTARTARALFAASVAAYGMAAAAAAARVAEPGDRPRDAALTMFAFPLMHAAWGAGFWWGVARDALAGRGRR